MKKMIFTLAFIAAPFLYSPANGVATGGNMCMELGYCEDSGICRCGDAIPCIYMNCGYGTELCYQGEPDELCLN